MATPSDDARARVLVDRMLVLDRPSAAMVVAQALADERAAAEARSADLLRKAESAAATRFADALRRERVLLRRAVGIVSDVATLEREIGGVLDDFARMPLVDEFGALRTEPLSDRCRHQFAPSAATRAPLGPCVKCGALPGSG